MENIICATAATGQYKTIKYLQLARTKSIKYDRNIGIRATKTSTGASTEIEKERGEVEGTNVESGWTILLCILSVHIALCPLCVLQLASCIQLHCVCTLMFECLFTLDCSVNHSNVL